LAGVHWKLSVEDGVWLCIVELFTFLVVQAAPEEIDALVIQINVPK
jgi:hypothetical protein